jgi:hypothetical protein
MSSSRSPGSKPSLATVRRERYCQNSLEASS